MLDVMCNFMNRSKYILAFLFFSFASIAWNSRSSIANEKEKGFNCGFYINKRTADLFQVRSSLTFNCDSTFLFVTTSCLTNSRSEGKWRVQNNSILLFTSKKILKLIKKEENKKVIFRKHVDLTGQKLIINDSLLIWTHSIKYIDTFSISYPGQYALKY